MHTKKLIPINEFCANHQIETSFIDSLQDIGLIELTKLKNKLFIENNQLKQLEKILCFHYELDINLEGIESISNLLQQIEYLQAEIIGLKNKLRLYETTQHTENV